MAATIYRVTVSPRFPEEGGRSVQFTVSPSDPHDADRYGITPEQVAYAVAADYCDSGTVVVEDVRDRNHRAVVARR